MDTQQVGPEPCAGLGDDVPLTFSLANVTNGTLSAFITNLRIEGTRVSFDLEQ